MRASATPSDAHYAGRAAVPGLPQRNLDMTWGERLDDYGYPKWDDNVFPIAYLITFRTFGTWLHGDVRSSVKRDGWNRYQHPRYPENPTLERWMKDEMKSPPFLLDDEMRDVVTAAVVDACEKRGFFLLAVNVRTNHTHSVISAQMKPERIADALKANATKRLRERGLIGPENQVWSRGRSRRYLWKPGHVAAAIDYTLYGQGDFVLPD